MKRERTFKTYVSMGVEQANRQSPEIIKTFLMKDPEIFTRSIDERLWNCMGKGKVILNLPSLRFCPICTQEETKNKTPTVEDLGHVNVTFACKDQGLLLEMKGILESHEELIETGADIAFDAADHWCPTQQSGRQFGDRASANRLIGLKALADENLTGKGVYVVIVDRGLNKEDVVNELKGNFGGGWGIGPENGGPCIAPGSLNVVRGVTNNDHGMMIARNVLAVAPDVCLYDLPLIPPRIVEIRTFLSDANAAFERVLADIKCRRAKNPGEKWILVNAWAPFDRMSEKPWGNYSRNRDHPFLKLIGQMAGEGIEMVFAAGNCGQFCPDPRCGPYDIGPGNSIYGANAHPQVLTVGAITTHPIGIGFSSQGKGPVELALKKPDLVAPSMFSENSDRHTRNGGTSAACAMAAGVLAALRQRWGPKEILPEVMKQCLQKTAWRPGASGWDHRLGWGVINAEAALSHLTQQCNGAG